MSFTSTQLQESSPPSFYLAKKTAMCAPKRGRVYAYQTLGPRERNSPVTNTAVKELRKRVSYVIPSFAARASSNTKCGPTFLGGPQIFFPHGFPDGVHILDLLFWSLQIYKAFFLAMLAECVSSFVRLTTLILLPECLLGDLWFKFCHESSA